MSKKELLFFKDMLLAGRAEILDRIQMLTSALRNLNEHEIEVEEGVQKSIISNPYDRMGNDGRQRIELIDLALWKMAVGEYGVCESCGDDIAVKRLEAVPWTRQCIDCARENEKRHDGLSPPAGVISSARLPDEYRGLSGEELIKVIKASLGRHFEAEELSVKITALNGVIYLEGSIGSETDRQLILQTVTDDMGFEAVVDLMEVEAFPLDGSSHIPTSIPFPQTADYVPMN